MRRLLLFIVLAILFPGIALAQTQTVNQPDCVLPFYFSTSVINGTTSLASTPVSTASFDNRNKQCVTWTLSYQVTGLSGVSIEFDGAPDNNGAAGLFTTWTNLLSGSLPLTSTTYSQVSGYSFAPWLEVLVNSVTGNGQITGVLNGYRAYNTNSSTGLQAVSCSVSGCPPNTNAAASNAETVMSPTDFPISTTALQPGSGITSYVAASSGGVTLAATPSDIAVLPGNGTTNVYVTQVQVSCTQTTTGAIDVFLIKRSTADAGGASTNMTVGPMDSSDAANNSTPVAYTANPSTGTIAARVDVQKITFGAPAGAFAVGPYIWTPPPGQTVVLRGATQSLAVNLNGQTTTGAVCDVRFNWTEK